MGQEEDLKPGDIVELSETGLAELPSRHHMFRRFTADVLAVKDDLVRIRKHTSKTPLWYHRKFLRKRTPPGGLPV